MAQAMAYYKYTYCFSINKIDGGMGYEIHFIFNLLM